MKKKDLWTVILIVAVGSILAFIANVAMTNVAALSPYTNVAKIVNANDCNADGKCGTNSIAIGNFDYRVETIEGGQVVPVTLNGIVFEIKLFFVPETREYAVFDIEKRGSGNQQRVAVAPGETFLLDSETGLEISNLAISVEHKVDFMLNIGSGIMGNEETFTSNNWRGEGNAYVCFDELGSIFRSDSPCR